jgi:hypothetical protein
MYGVEESEVANPFQTSPITIFGYDPAIEFGSNGIPDKFEACCGQRADVSINAFLQQPNSIFIADQVMKNIDIFRESATVNIYHDAASDVVTRVPVCGDRSKCLTLDFKDRQRMRPQSQPPVS